MSAENHTIMGLRTQILEDWRYVHPENANVVIVTLREFFGPFGYNYQAVIAQDRDEGNRIFLKSQFNEKLELALHRLLELTSDMVCKASTEVPTEALDVKPLDKDTNKTQDKSTNKRKASLEEIEMKRFHNALGHVLDQASRNVSKHKVLIPNFSMTSLLALSIKVLESYLHSSTTKSPEATTHIDLRAQILDNWRYLHPFHTNVSVIVLTLEGRLWGHRYQAIITEDRIQDGKIFMATDPKDNIELALHALLDATGDKINKMLYERYESSLKSKS
ncbi:hypothetical protein KCV07_g5223, partial [Aureobasidium melanogenum]